MTELPLAPFREWLDQQPQEGLARRLEVSRRTLYRWRNEGRAIHLTSVDEALLAAGMHLYEVYPELYSEPALKHAVVDPKPCQHCGEDIPLRRPCGKRFGPVRYAQQKYCSRECYRERWK